MEAYHELAELAPRDEVARAVHTERASVRGAFLDCREAVGEHFPEHFPTVFAACKSAGIDPRTDMIPIAPAAHYHMGGIVPDFWGKSSLDGLSVCGECTSTGVHGANRLASNSLLEAVVFAHRIAERLREADLPDIRASRGHVPDALPHEALQSLRTAMSDKCGVVRDAKGLSEVAALIDQLRDQHGPARAVTSAGLIVKSAQARHESRGGHYRSDFPDAGEPRRRFLQRPFEETVSS